MKKVVVLNVVGLTKRLIGEHTPFLSNWTNKKNINVINPAFPAVTCTAQSNYLTGKYPENHGIVGNGWYFKDECEIKFWKQSNQLVQAPKIWDVLKRENKEFTCANLFWWYNMYSSVDYSVTPRPQYTADGRKIPDIYTNPPELRERLQKELGQFPLFNFWGPTSSIKSTRWIAECAKRIEELYSPTLSLVYLPHLDYGLQKKGNDLNLINKELQEIDLVCKDLIKFFEKRGAEVIVLSEYGVTNVNRPIHLNRILRKEGLIRVREERGTELLDTGASEAFAVADHQVAHIYVNNKNKLKHVREILEKEEEIELILDEVQRKEYQLDHERSGDLVVSAKKDAWFSYYYWLEDKRAPDFARTVDIHRKPGYDPVELFFNPDLELLLPRIGWKLLQKKMGMRTLMDLIPLDATLVRGSHGRTPEDKMDWPVVVTSGNESKIIDSTEVFELIYNTVSAR